MTEEQKIKKYQKITALIFSVGLVQVFLFDFCYYLNWFGVNQRIYLHAKGLDGTMQNYTYGELVFNLDSYILLIGCTWTFKRATNQLPYMKYIGSFAADCFITGVIFTSFYNPYYLNWDLWYCLIIAVAIFIGQVLLHKHLPFFRKFKTL